jgi:hypothetical protein
MISTRLHGVIDYATAALLILSPYLFGFATGGIEHWIVEIVGVALLGMSLLTRYELSVAKVISLGTHLAVDLAAGVLLALSPWLFGFADVIWWPHLLIGLMEIAVSLLTRRVPDTAV